MSPANSTAGGSILIAEDSPTQALSLQHTLVRHGYRVTVAANGREALEHARRDPPSVIISDVLMPEMDGYELARAVKSDAQLAGTPVILLTTLSDPRDVIRGLQCQADSFIPKPYEEQNLLARVAFAILNRGLDRGDRGDGVEIMFDAERHLITAGRVQILNLLLSTYDAAIQRNRQLRQVQEELRAMNHSLADANARLGKEVHERKEAEAAVAQLNADLSQRAAQLEEANRELESFSYSVSHDLRAPLRHVQGYVELLRQDTGGNLSEKSQRYLRTIGDAAIQMGQLIDDLLAFSRMGRAALREAPVALDDLVQEAMRGLEMAVQGRNIEWRIEALPRVLGDPSMLRQVLANLLGNAVKYSKQRDPAVIEIGTGADEGDQAVIFVKDNGAGFDMAYAHKLFGVFQRLHRPEEFEGTGIGLALVRRIIARHGGRIWAEATPGQGATFSFTLRKAEPGL